MLIIFFISTLSEVLAGSMHLFLKKMDKNKTKKSKILVPFHGAVPRYGTAHGTGVFPRSVLVGIIEKANPIETHLSSVSR